KIKVPMLSAANWAHHLHTRGNFEADANSASGQKWLEVHGLEHWSLFYSDYGVNLQKRFFGHFLKGEDTGWDRQPPVFLNLRKVDGTFLQRAEQEWPLARTRWTRFYLDTERLALVRDPVARSGSATFKALGEGLTFLTEPLQEETEITGPAAAKLFVASSTTDADIFLVLRVLDPEGQDVKFISGIDPGGVITNGWLRASHRKLDPKRSLPYRPWHPHDERWPLTPSETVELDVEIWPTSVIVPAGYRIGVSVLGRDFKWPGEGPWPEFYPGVPMKGNGVFLHDDPRDRPAEIFGGTTTLVSGGEQQSYLLLPVIPNRTQD
ncbi:MAG: CocE/NonD family hydrolase C-terminal non-catalytic domain-containing protein, partial [candidate division NC10 bacterium]